MMCLSFSSGYGGYDGLGDYCTITTHHEQKNVWPRCKFFSLLVTLLVAFILAIVFLWSPKRSASTGRDNPCARRRMTFSLSMFAFHARGLTVLLSSKSSTITILGLPAEPDSDATFGERGFRQTIGLLILLSRHPSEFRLNREFPQQLLSMFCQWHVRALPNCPVTDHLLDDKVAVASNNDALARQGIVEEIFENSDERGILGHVVGCLAAIRWCVHGRTLVDVSPFRVTMTP